MAWAEVYFRTNWRPHPSSRLATIDMGQNWVGWLCPFFWGKLCSHRTQSRLDRGAAAYLSTKWNLSPSSCSATTDIGRKLGALPPFGGGELGPYLAQCGLGQGPPACQVPPSSIQPFGHNRHGPKIGKGAPPHFWGGVVGPRVPPCQVAS